jgi:hypothetical protein
VRANVVRKRHAFLLVVLVALVGATVATSAQSGPRLIKVLSKTTNTDVLDKLPKGTSKGDVIVGGSLLINAVAQFTKPNGAVVGRDHFRAVYATASVATMSVTATLPGGTISCEGKIYTDRARIVLRIVGATGVFARATGTCEATKAPKNRYGADSLNLYRLQIPG